MATNGKKGLVRVTISEQIKEQLMEDIFHHKYKPGEKMVESALAKEFGVSQTSIREALRSLIAMGFLESEPFKGITVKRLSKKDLGEVYTVRGALESLAANLAAERITEKELNELDRICDAMLKAVADGDVPHRIKLNIEFHEALMRVSGNSILVKLYEYMQFATWSLMTGTLSTMEPEKLAGRHKGIVQAIRSGDKAQIESSLREHNETGRKPVFEALEDNEALV